MSISRTTPDWLEHAIGWHVYPLGFTGAPVHGDESDAAVAAAPGTARLDHLIDWLDYVQELGLNVLQLGPIFESATHGYDTLDYFRIDRRLGDDAAFDRLIAAAHERGIKVLLDGVFNHLSSQAPMFREALDDPDSASAKLFDVDRSGEEPTAPCFEGHLDLVEFDHRAPETAEFVESVMRHWLERGIDGWRLDAAYAVDPDFWARVLPSVRADFPHAFVYGEVIHGDYVDIVTRSTMDSVTEYELWKATWSALKDHNFYELEWTLGRHDAFLESFVPVTFVGNHDVTRIASRVGQDKAVLALVVLMTVGGIPLIYYGDEQGYTGVKEERFGGDDQVRPVFPATPEELSSLGNWMHDAHRQLIGLRRRHPWLHRATVTVTSIANERITYDVGADGRSLAVALEVTGKPSVEIREGENVEYRFPRP
ncbi:alpha-amylase family protein [Corynebacterium freneyi]|uniref:alpha-amylase family protein n=1 Tax=Corynebacterium freneyi TaxID=134034 RepID=UPI001EF313B7|nr:alpha-amylase family protein [Corynebacterium freneyi]MCG7439257.1 alpha-amylase family protein [Corynebacterium freneyi]